MSKGFWGVDFGTTTTYLSSSARFADKLIHIGRVGEPFIPSVAGFDFDKLLFCEDTARLDESYKIRSIKYLITRGFGKSPSAGISEATDLIANRYKLVDSPVGKPGQWLEVQSTAGPQTIEVGDVIRGIFRTMIGRAEIEGESKSVARMGCPAMWDGDQRRRLMDYAQDAGLAISDGTLIDEPIAACINWIEQNRHRKIEGNVLIFDMGGGTLDVSLIHVKAHLGEEPSVYVLSSFGKSEAGNQFDWHISNAIIQKLSSKNHELQGVLTDNLGWVDLVARQMKENLLGHESAVGTLNIPGIEPIPVTLSRAEIAESISGQMKDAMSLVHETIRAGLVTGLDTASLAEEEISSRTKEYRRLPSSETLGYVDYFVLAGGMVQMPLLREILIESGVDPHKLENADRNNPGEAIARGLGSESMYQRMNLHLPSFSFRIRWIDPETDQSHDYELYKAHTRLAPLGAGFLGSPDFTNTFSELKHRMPRKGFGEIYALSLDGLRVKFELDGEVLDGLEFEFGPRTEPILRISQSGAFFIRDTSENIGQEYKISGWPIVRSEENSTMKIKKYQRRDSRTGTADDESQD